MIPIPIWKKIIVALSLALLMLCVVAIGSVKGDETDMYVEVFDKNGTHISNINIKKWSITRRVFEFDTSTFEGTCEDDITNGLLFIFKDNSGTQEYSGFMKNITQNGELVKFKGDDLRRMFDTEILLDYTQEDYTAWGEDYLSFYNVMWDIKTEIADQIPDGPSIQVIIPDDIESTAFLSNPAGNYFFVNAWQYIKPYLAYYNYYLKIHYEAKPTNKYVWEFVASTTGRDIRLDDFVFDKTSTEVKINHVVAMIKGADLILETHTFVYSSKELYDATPAGLKYIEELNVADQAAADAVHVSYFNDGAREEYYPQDFVFKVDIYGTGELSSVLYRTFYMQIVPGYTAKPTATKIEYWLGKDNEIYYNSVPATQEITPAITKYYEAEYLSAAQFKAVWDLANSRYIEYIILTDIENIPIDIKTLTLYEMVTVYDSEGISKIVPVSEIEWTQDGYKVKLGFKKILLTEIIKGG